MATRQKSTSVAGTENKPIRIPFYSATRTRSNVPSKDQRAYNCYTESKKDEIGDIKKSHLLKRPGLSLRRQYTAGTARGVFRWESADYVAIGNTVYKDAVSLITLSTSTGKVNFIVVKDDYTFKLLISDGSLIYGYDGTTVEIIPLVYSDWATITAKSAGNRVIPTVENGFFYECVLSTGNTAVGEPTWPVVIGDQIVDGSVTWKCAGYYAFSVNIWVTLAVIQASQQVVPTTANGYYYTCTTAGTTAGTQPSWPMTVGGTVTDGTVVWTCTAEVDFVYPAPKNMLPYPVFLDGTIYMIAKDSTGNATADIYNSDVNNISSWNQVDYISAEQYTDKLSCLIKQHNYICALGNESCEFFIDTAEASGSPLSRNDSFTVHVGLSAPDSVVQQEMFFIFVGGTGPGENAVWRVDNYTPKTISDEFINRVLAAEGSSISNATGYICRASGHIFYFLRLTSRTLVYDLDEKTWHEWTSNSNGSHANWVGKYGADLGDQRSLILDATSGALYILDSAIFEDNSVSILEDMYTGRLDFETSYRKTMHRLAIVGDVISSGTAQIRWSDDDESTWSSYETISLDDPTTVLHQLGQFRRRTFNYRYTGNTAYRCEGMDAEITLGVS